jgi:thiamine pyrophosphate-dependent acetolactate synthase large subunit-like protein
MIDTRDAMRAFLPYRKNSVVVTTDTSVLCWGDVTDNDNLDLPNPAMSKASSLALGVAIAQPNCRVVVWDGDGGLLMNLGSLVSIGEQSPSNLLHIVLCNGMYAMTGGQPVPNADEVNYIEMALAAGYAKTYEFENLEDWITNVEDILNLDGPVMVVLKTVPELTDWINDPPDFSGIREIDNAAIAVRASLSRQN